MVVDIFVAAFLSIAFSEVKSFLNLSSKCGTICGSGKGCPGKGSILANCPVVALIVLFATSLSNSSFRFRKRIFLFLPGCTSDGALGNTHRAAISPQLNLSALRPKYRQADASRPTTLLPKGALAAYSAMMVFLR